MLKIKLSPRGTKHHIGYRIVVAEARSKYNGNFVDDLGFYTSQTKTLEVDKAAIETWQKNGALLTIGVDKLLNPTKFVKKVKKPVEPKAKVEIKTEAKVEAETEAEVETKKE
jgi:ribosomal protein S16